MKPGVDHIGVTCVFYCYDGKGNFLLQKRSKNCCDEIGCWDCGGGTMRHGETFEKTVRREIKEEYCTDVISLKYLGVNNVLRKHEGKRTHWVAVLFVVHIDPAKVKIGVPRKMQEIGWFSPKKFPNPLHSMFLTHFEHVKNSGVI